MKARSIFIIAGVIAVLAIIYASVMDGGSSQEYAEQILDARKEQARYLQTSKESPFAADRESFHGLNYYPPNEKYRVVAKLEPIEHKEVRVVSTSDGAEVSYLEYAYATFDLDNRKNKLLILEIMDMGPQRGKLFLAFADQTSGDETYGAGRYLDIEKVPGSSTITLDFNKAYNPYCAYSDAYSCPFPPRENILEIPIEAGEKNYSDNH